MNRLNLPQGLVGLKDREGLCFPVNPDDVESAPEAVSADGHADQFIFSVTVTIAELDSLTVVIRRLYSGDFPASLASPVAYCDLIDPELRVLPAMEIHMTHDGFDSPVSVKIVDEDQFLKGLYGVGEGNPDIPAPVIDGFGGEHPSASRGGWGQS